MDYRATPMVWLFPGQKSVYALYALCWGVYVLHFIHMLGYVPGIKCIYIMCSVTAHCCSQTYDCQSTTLSMFSCS